MENNAASLARDLVRQASVTPDATGALDLVQGWLEPHGFACYRLVFEASGTPPVDNLFARRGTGHPHFCFAGHLDVVPPGDTGAWTDPPFAGTVRNGRLYGRGAEDMKGGVAAFLAAAMLWARSDSEHTSGSVSLLLTGDEEGPAVNGTVKVLAWMAENGHIPDHCLVGEPTGVDVLGDVAKNGRRGSLNGQIVVSGTQGHVAYPHRAANPLPSAMRLAGALLEPLDHGTEDFEPSNLEVTSIDTGNLAANIIPGRTELHFNCRFNDTWGSKSLEVELRRRLEQVVLDTGVGWHLETQCNAESFVTPKGPLTDLVCNACSDITGITPQMTTGGGTSDARFVTRHCPVVEFGPVGRTMHQIDENVPVADLEKLAEVYHLILERYFSVMDRGS